jgi:hypothetical protein
MITNITVLKGGYINAIPLTFSSNGFLSRKTRADADSNM